MAVQQCRVSFKDSDGIRHAVEVQAESVYEAAVLALKAFKKSPWIESLGPATRIDIEVLQPPIQHFMMYAQLTRWLDGAVTNPAEAVKKKRLKQLLAS